MVAGDGRAVLVTGCSTGFGLLVAVRLAEQGWRVTATMRDLGKREALDNAAARAGVTVTVEQLDVCDAESIARFADAGPFHAVVHNAGVAHAGFFEDLADERFRTVFETNVFGVLAVTRAILPGMRTLGGGRLVIVSSASALLPGPGLSAYAASKTAIEGWAEAVGIELAPFGIDVVLIEPGTFKTEIWDNATVARVPGSVYAPFVAALEPRIRANVAQNGRDPAEVAALIARVLAARRPRLRYRIGPNRAIAWMLARAVPYQTRRRLISRVTGITDVARGIAGRRPDSPSNPPPA